MLNAVRVGLIDGGVGGPTAAAVVAARSFIGAEVAGVPASSHGSQVGHCVLQHCASADLFVAQVFCEGREATVDAVVAGLAWLVEQGAQVVNMSFGMSQASPRLSRACRAAAASGVVLVASAPARGGLAFPAAFGECIAVSGDARCAPGEVSWLASAGAEFGTHPFLDPDDPRRGGGASIATARMTGLLAAELLAGADAGKLRSTLAERASYFGPERRHA